MEEILSQIWDVLSDLFGGVARGIERGITSLFGSSNARYLKKLQPTVDAINALEPRYQTMTDSELREQSKGRRAGGNGKGKMSKGKAWGHPNVTQSSLSMM